ncbi:hypothetical protein [Litorisediminicola beolgyonensis]|uniref:Cyclic nucleotide-binding domain-containing protein n=1 Tax=Litorisediminicola beolgyonensis TaxID=1173614 RepID=A0ABW3ZKI2_9RHOB
MSSIATLAEYGLYVGFALKILGFLARDELKLRGLIVIGFSLDVLFYATRMPPVTQSVWLISAQGVINIALIVLIVLERSTLGMSAQDKRLFAAFRTLNPGQFRRLMKLAERRQSRPDEALLTEGQPVTHLFWTEAPKIAIAKGDTVYSASGPVFLGEIGLLLERPASATVSLDEGTEIVTWPVNRLRAVMARRPAFSNALVARFSSELAEKLAVSVPMPDIAAPRQS